MKKTVLKILKILGVSFAGLLILLVLLVYFFVNNEDVHYNAEHKTIVHQDIQEEMQDDPFVLMVLSSSCSAVTSDEGMSLIKEDIALCKAHDIPYYIVFNELHFSQMDAIMDEFKENTSFDEPFYFIDPLAYKENIKVIQQDRRLRDFLGAMIPEMDTVMIGYPMYYYFDKGAYKGRTHYNLKEGVKKFFNSN